MGDGKCLPSGDENYFAIDVKSKPMDLIKEEEAWTSSDHSEGADLYAGHQVKDEVVIGPDTLQPRDIAYSLCELNSTLSTDEDLHVKEECLNEALFGEMVEFPGGEDQMKQELKQKEIEDAFINFVETERPKLSNNLGSDEIINIKSLQNYSQDLPEFKRQCCIVKVKRINFNAFHTCKDCPKIFATEDSLTKHSRYHEENTKESKTSKIYICDKCGKKYENRIGIQKHLSTHSAKFPCYSCDKVFTQKTNLIRHSRIHDDKRFSCDECSKEFTYKHFLDRHKKLHTGERFSCEICMKHYVHKCDLKRHTRVHTGIVKLQNNAIKKRFSCEYCPKKFDYKHILTKHKLLHTGQKQFLCEQCPKGFTQKCHLIRHKQIHTNEKPYLCETCSRRFALKHHLTRHFRIHKP